MIGFEIIIHIIILLYEIISSKIMCRGAINGKHTFFQNYRYVFVIQQYGRPMWNI